ncbi:MAG: hypothetical protein J1F35_01965 [Erysipelotrichales bacterium]|nr:hypothetical protein [Erysipelotrichales bacterium]
MNNEDKRFKTINRVATPIQLDKDGNEIKEQMVAITPENVTTKKVKKQKKEVDINLVLKVLIVLLVIGNLSCLVYLFVPNAGSSKIKYNDVPADVSDDAFSIFTSKTVEKNDHLTDGKEYKINDRFKIKIINREVLVNGKKITDADKVSSEIGLIDDLIMFTTENNNIRSKALYAVDEKGTKYLDIHNIENGKVIMNDAKSLDYQITNVIIKTSNVLNDAIYLGESLDSLNPISICDNIALSTHSTGLNTSVITYYRLDYLEDHKFSELVPTYEVTLGEYRSINNYCN